MAESTKTHGYWDLMRISRWHVEGEAIDRALGMSKGSTRSARGDDRGGATITINSDYRTLILTYVRTHV